MPENAYRKGHLRQHGASSSNPGGYSAARSRRLHPDWPGCAAGCGWPVNPAALVGGFTTHPSCDRSAA